MILATLAPAIEAYTSGNSKKEATKIETSTKREPVRSVSLYSWFPRKPGRRYSLTHVEGPIEEIRGVARISKQKPKIERVG